MADNNNGEHARWVFDHITSKAWAKEGRKYTFLLDTNVALQLQLKYGQRATAEALERHWKDVRNASAHNMLFLDANMNRIAVACTEEEAPPPAVKIEMPPGFKLHRFLASICPASFTESVLDELLADGTFLYQKLLAEGDLKGARRLKFAMRCWMLRAVFGGFITGAFALLFRWKRLSE